MTSTQLETQDGLALEARWDVPGSVDMALVLCHPHPLHGGTMTAPLLVKIVEQLVGHGIAVLRFNFRGIGESAGTWSGGTGEIDDVDAAMRTARATYPDHDLALAGWSFGAATALRWQAREKDTTHYVGIAPPVTSELTPNLPPPNELAEGARAFIVGDRDQFVTVDQLESYAGSIGAAVTVLKGSDHFFYFREARVADALLEHLAEPA